MTGMTEMTGLSRVISLIGNLLFLPVVSTLPLLRHTVVIVEESVGRVRRDEPQRHSHSWAGQIPALKLDEDLAGFGSIVDRRQSCVFGVGGSLGASAGAGGVSGWAAASSATLASAGEFGAANRPAARLGRLNMKARY